MASSRTRDDDLAYGEYHEAQEEGDSQERGFFGDIYHRIGNLRPSPAHQKASAQPQASSSTDTMSAFFGKVQGAVHQLGTDLKSKIGGIGEIHSHTHYSEGCTSGFHDHHAGNRYLSFAPERPDGNQVKWYVDGCGYMWAVSMALEQARESIWILDWWLSPELYLRRPPSKNEQYRIDNLLKAAAERGVKVNVIVYKEVTQALTRKYLNPWHRKYRHLLFPNELDEFTKFMAQLGLHAIFEALERTEKEDPLIAPPITVSSSHTKHTLEDLHPNIAVVRHPDHLPDQQSVAESLIDKFKNFEVSAATAAQLPGDALKAIYGVSEDTILYWAHHEKLCLVDGHIAFMGGLDLCYGRWDTNQHSIADAHPGDINQIVYPGQDYNNSRIMDFQDVQHWQNNKLDRRENSRMGWSDIALSLTGPAVEDLKEHFVQRWNFIYKEKYFSRPDKRYSMLQHSTSLGGYQQPSNTSEERPEHGLRALSDFGNQFKHKMEERIHDVEGKIGHAGHDHWGVQHATQPGTTPFAEGTSCQIVRSEAKWSAGTSLEHSIANAYIEVIKNSQHFVYIENQFFITATSDNQKPVRNKIGAAIVERIIRAAREGQKFKVIVLMPAVPAFAGDLRADDALSTRAIMEFQYNSICRGGHSIYESLAREGLNPMDYIRFYNLRNYDRINVSAAMQAAEQASGVPYEEARKEHDDSYGGGYNPPGQPNASGYGDQPQYQSGAYDAYQQGAQQIGNRQGLGSGKWDTVASCYMLGGEDIRNVPWEDGNVPEIDAFVTEELYIHSKLLIADDRVVICGSANLNDRSQLGDHDSEIAIVIEDRAPLESQMNGQPWTASRFAASLRRQVFRKHLGLLKPQNYESPDQNYYPITQGINEYDWGSPEDQLVADPLNDGFLNSWNSIAATNTEVFNKVFHVVPTDNVTTWKAYDEWYERLFRTADPKDPKKPAGPLKVGHVVRDEFPQGINEVKEWLSRVKGTLVEMPLKFLKEEDIAKEGLSLNAFTEAVYT